MKMMSQSVGSIGVFSFKPTSSRSSPSMTMMDEPSLLLFYSSALESNTSWWHNSNVRRKTLFHETVNNVDVLKDKSKYYKWTRFLEMMITTTFRQFCYELESSFINNTRFRFVMTKIFFKDAIKVTLVSYKINVGDCGEY